MKSSIRLQAALVSLFMVAIVLVCWQFATTAGNEARQAPMTPEQKEYALLMGQASGDQPAAQKGDGFPTPAQFFSVAAENLAHPFYDHGPNDKGIGIQLAHSLIRVAGGYLLAVAVSIPLGFLIGMSPLLYRAFDPFIQLLKPISPLAWMPIALYTIKDASISAIFVIFICSLWPMLINTAFGVANVRREWLNVARTLEVSPLRKALQIVLPAAAPTIITGMRISMGIAWLVIVAAEMLVGGTGVGYFLWNQWNNLSLTNVLFAVLVIGVVGMLLDQFFVYLQKKVTYAE
ncbi:nitrate ABC transporter permease [Paraburkholderia lycopersici]|uniref:Nitrate/nitrite transport system permease protein n=1 Tax=Paraburkholderia lycopersici TaxID=416944 RepID=A0A1G6WSB9_9BURK|nr:nitrate ABC transporter permease [Paraburkholderia lycopersici]SDD67935.1 nitrate/nitrite transport system permease protein [Paraburkholderia lycopersici]